MVTDFNECIQHFIWYYFVSVPLLGRNDYLSWNDDADGNLVDHNLDKKSIRKREKEVAIQRLTKKHIILLVVSGVIVTAVFYKILAVFSTPNIVFSTISVTTSFFAASLTMLRSSYYAVGYAANDVVLIVLWILVSIKEPRYLSVTVIFVIFLFFDLYGFISWKKREK